MKSKDFIKLLKILAIVCIIMCFVSIVFGYIFRKNLPHNDTVFT